MPSVSPKQHRFFEWIDHTPGAAQKAGVKKSVAHDFVQADVGRHFPGKKRAAKKRKLGDEF